MENLKFNIGDNPELSRIVQAVLFEFGYSWGQGQNKVKNTYYSYLFAYSRGNLTHTDDVEHFETHTHTEFDLTEIKEILLCNN
jgi:hypothetical protein